MAGALYQDWENYNPNNPTALRPPSYWDAVKQNLPHALRGFQRMPTNVMGFPVDMVNLVVGAEKPFLGSEYLAEKLNVPERTGHPTELGTEIASEFLLPTAQGLGRSALKAEEFLGRTLKEKLPEFVGKHVPEPFRTPITGLNIKPKEAIVTKPVGTHQWKIKHKENDGVFYRAEHEDGSGTKHGMLGSGRYFSNSEKDANIFMDEGKILSKYKIKEDLNLASAKQVDDISEEFFGMSIHAAPYGNPEFTEALTNVIKLKGFDGVYTDHNIMGTVIYDPRNYQKVDPVTGKLIKSKLTKIYKKPK